MFEICVGGKSNKYWEHWDGDLNWNGKEDRFSSFFQWLATEISLDLVLLTDVGCHCWTSTVTYHVINTCCIKDPLNYITLDVLGELWKNDHVPKRTDQKVFLYLGSSSYCFGNRLPAYAMSMIFEMPPKSMQATLIITTKPLNIHIDCQTSVQITAFIPPRRKLW